MSFLLANTLSGEKEEVFAANGKQLGIYCCGPTVYGPAHIGNFRTFIIQDIFRRVTELSGISVKHVRNITDVDDKTIRQSQAEGRSLEEFTQQWRTKFEEDSDALGLLMPHEAPSAVAHLPEQIQMIKELEAKGLAYQAEDKSVYFRISAFEGYGKLSRIDQRELKLGASKSANASDEYDKESIADFVLWKAWKEEDGENGWDSPWGRGRPGWHLECSAMSQKYLGDSFDMHSGGVDLIFPHHENEIAQSEGATGKPFVRHWLHVAHLMVDGGKMSKSLGNLYTIEDLIQKGFSAGEVRYVLASGHYRKQLNFTFDTLHSARQALGKLSSFSERLESLSGKPLPAYEELCKMDSPDLGVFEPAWNALLDDLNTAECLGKVFVGMRKAEAELGKEQSPESARAYQIGLSWVIHSLGIILPEKAEVAEIPEEIQGLAKQRWEAKLSKDWGKSDELRDALAERGWQVKDAKDSYEIRPIS
ncbi:MAG: cysteine--tRNA ligase [Verrucomicrobiota bacterium]